MSWKIVGPITEYIGQCFEGHHNDTRLGIEFKKRRMIKKVEQVGMKSTGRGGGGKGEGGEGKGGGGGRGKGGEGKGGEGGRGKGEGGEGKGGEGRGLAKENQVEGM